MALSPDAEKLKLWFERYLITPAEYDAWLIAHPHCTRSGAFGPAFEELLTPETEGIVKFIVTNTTQEPIENVTVNLRRWNSLGGTWDIIETLTTDVNGEATTVSAYAFTAEGIAYAYDLIHAGFESQIEYSIEINSVLVTKAAEMIAIIYYQISFHIEDSITHDPIEGVSVIGIESLITGPSGNCSTLSVYPIGDYVFGFSKEGYIPQAEITVNLINDTIPTYTCELVEVVVDGTVTFNVKTGELAAIVSAQVIVSQDGTPFLTGYTDSEGSYTTPILEFGDYTYIVNADGYESLIETPLTIDSSSKSELVVLNPVILQGVITFTIQSTDEIPIPLEGVSVEVVDLGGSPIFSGVTDANGVFQTCLISYGNYLYSAHLANYASVLNAPVTINAPDVPVLKSLEIGVEVIFQVFYQWMESIPNAQITFKKLGETVYSGLTDETGTLSVDSWGLGEGYTYSVEKEGYTSQIDVPLIVEFQMGGPQYVYIDFTLAPVSSKIGFNVLTGETPVNAATVVVLSRPPFGRDTTLETLTTDETGYCETVETYSNPVSETLVCVIEKNGFVTYEESIDIDVNPKIITIGLTQAGQFKFVIIDDLGAPISGASITIEVPRQEPVIINTDEFGEAFSAWLPYGTIYSGTVEAINHETKTFDSIAMNQPLIELDFTLARMGELQFTIKNIYGDGIQNAHVQVTDGVTTYYSSAADIQGITHVDAPYGVYTYYAYCAGMTPWIDIPITCDSLWSNTDVVLQFGG